MKFFDFEKIYIVSHGDSAKMLAMFKNETNGPNWIVNPKAIVDAFWVSDQHKAEYLGLCALRDYRAYLDNGIVDLPLNMLPPWIPIQILENNPLIQLTDKTIKFIKEK